jgi:catechol 2,3-dioxygenase-like lactoylglutathione lyase family enzyme
VSAATGIERLDHAAILVADLAGSEAAYRRLGFRTTPIGRHDGTGTANHRVMLDEDFFEILGVLTPTAFSRPWAEAIAVREGLHALAFSTDDMRTCHAGLVAAGFAPTEPAEFSRPVDLGGRVERARFTITYLEPAAVPGLRVLVCQHHTPDLVWRPDDLGQPNTARALAHVTLMVDDPAAAATAYGRITGTVPAPCPGGVEVAGRGAAIRLIAPAAATAEFGGDPVLRHRPPLPIGLGIEVADLEACAAALESAGVPHRKTAAGGLRVASTRTSGVVLDFVRSGRSP